VMFPPADLGFAVARAEAAAVAEAAEDRADAAEDGAAAAVAEGGAGAAEDREGAAGDGAGADEDWLAEQPTTARAARTTEAVAILMLF
jgi:hypothetical protein